MNLEQAAARLGGCSVRTVRRRIETGELKASHPGRGIWEISEQQLADYLERTIVTPRAREPRDVTPISTRPRRARPGAGGRLRFEQGMGRTA